MKMITITTNGYEPFYYSSMCKNFYYEPMRGEPISGWYFLDRFAGNSFRDYVFGMDIK